MTEFLFDFTATGCARVTADDLAGAVAVFKDVLDCYDPGITFTVDGVAGSITEISLGLLSRDQFVLSVAEADGESVRDDTDLDTMMTPVLCDRAGDDPECEGVYDEARGDGYLGLCPHCADTTRER